MGGVVAIDRFDLGYQCGVEVEVECEAPLAGIGKSSNPVEPLSVATLHAARAGSRRDWSLGLFLGILAPLLVGLLLVIRWRGL